MCRLSNFVCDFMSVLHSFVVLCLSLSVFDINMCCRLFVVSCVILVVCWLVLDGCCLLFIFCLFVVC